MPKFISPAENLEVWDEMPAGYTLPQELVERELHPKSAVVSVSLQKTESVPQLDVTEVIQHRLGEIKSILAANNQTFVQLFRAKTAGTATDAELDQLTALEADVKSLHAEQMTLEMQRAVLQTMKDQPETEDEPSTEELQKQSEQEQLSVEDIQKRITGLQQRIAEVDAAVVGPMRASFSGNATPEDEMLLAEFEIKAEVLRSELAVYENMLGAEQGN